jgi:hypothetical protein
MREGEELKTPHYASAGTTRDDHFASFPTLATLLLWLLSIYKYYLTSVVLQVHPVIPYTRPPIKPSYKTAICRNLPQPAIFCHAIKFYRILPNYRLLLNSAKP